MNVLNVRVTERCSRSRYGRNPLDRTLCPYDGPLSIDAGKTIAVENEPTELVV